MLKDRLENSAEFFHLLVFLDVCLVLHRAEVSLEEPHVEYAFLLTFGASKSLASTALGDLVGALQESSNFGVANGEDCRSTGVLD